jgi:hypothetical protein
VPIVSPRVAVGLAAVSAFVLWGLLAYEATVPRFFLDELYYMRAGVSFGQGHGLRFRDQGWGYGPLFPVLIGAVVRLTPDQEATYEVVKLVNAACFALATVPVYLLARRLLEPWPSVLVAAASVAIPSSMYVSVVMTESSSYLLASLALYAILLALEAPTVGRQALAIATAALGVAARPQLVALYGAYLLGLAIVLTSTAVRRRHLRSHAAALWPTALSVVLGLAWVLRPLVTGSGTALGSYSTLAQSYDPLQVAKWFAYHVGDLGLYLAVAPLAVAPCVIAAAWRKARTGSDRDAAFVALFVAQNLLGIGLVAAFASTEFGLGLLYDRYLFYLVPLWLVVLGVWFRDGMPRPALPLGIGGLLAAATVATLPFGGIGQENWFAQFEATSTELWGKVGVVARRLPVVDVRLVAIAFALGLVGLVALAPQRRRWLVASAVGLVLAANLALAWRGAFVDPATYGSQGRGTRDWVDARIGTHADAVFLTAGGVCAGPQTPYFSSLETEFFNRSVHGRLVVGQTGTAAPKLTLLPDGRVVTASGRELRAGYVVTDPPVRLRGRLLGRGMSVGLALWRVQGAVRIENARSDRELFDLTCPG